MDTVVVGGVMVTAVAGVVVVGERHGAKKTNLIDFSTQNSLV
jgi:hypothetical protein